MDFFFGLIRLQNINETKRQLLEKTVRKAVFEATVETVTNKGSDSLQMRQIASQAGVATGTLYNYFKGRDDLLFYVYEKLFDDFFAQISNISRCEYPPGRKIIQIIKVYFLFVRENLAVFKFLYEGKIFERADKISGYKSDEKCIEVLTEILQEGVNKGIFKGIDPYRTAELVHCSIFGVIILKMERDCLQFDQDEDDLVGLFSCYLGIKDKSCYSCQGYTDHD